MITAPNLKRHKSGIIIIIIIIIVVVVVVVVVVMEFLVRLLHEHRCITVS